MGRDTCVVRPKGRGGLQSNPKRMRAVLRLRGWEKDRQTRRQLRKHALSGTYLLARLEGGQRVTPVPVEDMGLRPRDVGPPGTYDAQLLGLVLLHVAMGRPSLMVSHRDAATIIGCHPNTVANGIARLVARGWVEKHEQYEAWTEGPRDADGVPTRHRQIVNTYVVGDKARYLYDGRHARRELQAQAAQRRRLPGSQPLGSDRSINSAKAEKASTRTRASGPLGDNLRPDPLAKLAHELQREARGLLRQRNDERARAWREYEAAKLKRSSEVQAEESKPAEAEGKERPTAAIAETRPPAAAEAMTKSAQSEPARNPRGHGARASVERTKQGPPRRPSHPKASPAERALLRKARLLYMPEPVATVHGEIPARVLRYAMALEEDGRLSERDQYLAVLYEDMDRKKYELQRADVLAQVRDGSSGPRNAEE